jgi:hypothetical protein
MRDKLFWALFFGGLFGIVLSWAEWWNVVTNMLGIWTPEGVLFAVIAFFWVIVNIAVSGFYIFLVASALSAVKWRRRKG